MQLKYDTIEKHYGKAYVKIVDEDGMVRKQQIVKDETKCFDKKYEIEYNKMMEEKKFDIKQEQQLHHNTEKRKKIH